MILRTSWSAENGSSSQDEEVELNDEENKVKEKQSKPFAFRKAFFRESEEKNQNERNEHKGVTDQRLAEIDCRTARAGKQPGYSQNQRQFGNEAAYYVAPNN